jgi:hypothetical protein
MTRFRRSLALLALPVAAGCGLIVGDSDPFMLVVADGAPDDGETTFKPDGANGTVTPDGSTSSDAASKDASKDSSVDAFVDAGCTTLSLHFATPTDGVAIPDSPTLAFGASGTMEAWVWLEVSQADGAAPNVFNKFTDSAEDKRIWFGSDLTPVGFLFPSVDLVGSTQAKTKVWTHVAHSWSAAGQTLFLNGTNVSTGAAPTPANAAGMAHIGYLDRADAGNPPVYGFISEVRISDVARYSANFTPPTHLMKDKNTLAFWRLAEGAGTTAKDFAMNGNDGVISGATWEPAPCR